MDDLKKEKVNQDPEFYQELHTASRSYDVKLWAIPAIFFTIIGLLFDNINLKNFSDPQNFWPSLFGVIFLLVLIVQFYKTHFFNLSIQKKINNFDKEFGFYESDILRRMPLESMNKAELNQRIYELDSELKSEDGSLTFFQKFLVKQRVTSLMKQAMFISWLFVVVILISSLSKIISHHIY